MSNLNKADQMVALKKGQFVTGSTDLAAALMACGVTPSEGSPVSNTYTEAKPHRTGRPGEVLYHLDRHSSTFKKTSGENYLAEELVKGFQSPDANEVLDDLISQIDDEILKKKIEEQLPLAIMSHHRAAFGNRQIIRKWWRMVKPFVYLTRGKKRFLLSKDSKKTKSKWGLNK